MAPAVSNSQLTPWLCAESLKCYKWSHFTVLPVQCRARLSMAVTAASNARSRAWGAKKKGWKVQILLAIIDLLIYILKVLCSYLQHLLLFRSPVVLLFKKQEFRSQQPICHCNTGLKNRICQNLHICLDFYNITRSMVLWFEIGTLFFYLKIEIIQPSSAVLYILMSTTYTILQANSLFLTSIIMDAKHEKIIGSKQYFVFLFISKSFTLR